MVRTLERAAGIGPGDHVCWGYEDRAGFVQAVTQFLAEGAGRGERLVYTAPASEGRLVADLGGLPGRDRMLESGQLSVRELASAYSVDGLDPAAQVESWRGEAVTAKADGWASLRVAGDVTPLATDAEGMADLVAYELAVDAMIAATQVTGLCGYSVAALGPRLGQVAALHPVQHRVDRDGSFALRLRDHRLGVMGELDIADVEDLRHVLWAVAGSVAGPITVDLGPLAFIDIASTRVLAQFVQAMASEGRPVDFVGAAPAARRCLELFGLGQVVA